jgi:uncharacterized membrane protein
MMSLLFALVAAVLTSFLPLLNKYLLRESRPAVVAWITNAASLPLLALFTAGLTACSLSWRSSPQLSCIAQVPHVDAPFVAALLASAALNWAATLLSTMALAKADASLISPLLTFNPAFTLLIAWFSLDEVPGVRQTLGVLLVLMGAYLLEVEQARTGWLTPLRLLLRRPGTLLAILASAAWGATTVLEKLAIEQMAPPSGPVVALLETMLLVLLLTPGAWWMGAREAHGKERWKGLAAHPHALWLSVLIASIAPLFGFSAIALGMVGYVTAIFKLSAVLTTLWAWWLPGEGQIRGRLLGASVMMIGGLLVAV